MCRSNLLLAWLVQVVMCQSLQATAPQTTVARSLSKQALQQLHQVLYFLVRVELLRAHPVKSQSPEVKCPCVPVDIQELPKLEVL
jgi:hypothetical protein